MKILPVMLEKIIITLIDVFIVENHHLSIMSF